ncbi:MAG: hypothetical protein M1819_004967 [Sarea resinae]|nr:MAG: hypothetical protein M1819_004967 [Sarea resinae]
MNRTSTSPARLRSPLHRSATATADLSPPSRSSTAPTHPQLHHTHHLNLQNNAASKRLRLTGGLSAGFGSSPGQPSYYEYTRDKSMTQSATHLHPPYGNDLQLSRTLSSRNMASASGTSSNVISRRGSLVALGEAPEQGEEKKIIDAAELAREKDKAKGRDE